LYYKLRKLKFCYQNIDEISSEDEKNSLVDKGYHFDEIIDDIKNTSLNI